MHRIAIAVIASCCGALLYDAAVHAQSRTPVKKATTEGSVFFSGEIVSLLSNKCLDVTDESLRDGAAIQQWSCAKQPNQLWTIIDQGRGEYSIVSQRSKKSIDIAGNNDGDRIVQNDFVNVDNQRWRLEISNTGTYQIINTRTKKCIDLQEGKRDDGVKVQLWSCSGQPNQAWLLRK